jgi:hypothetical protein
MVRNKHKKPARKPRRAILIDGDLRRMIQQEARKLNMSEEEYLRLAVHFSEAIRTAALPAGLLDGGFLTAILGNPMIMDMIKGMIGNAITKYFNKDGTPSNTPSPQTHAAPAMPYGGGYRPPIGPAHPQGMHPQPHGMHPMGHAPGMYGMPGMRPHTPSAQPTPAESKDSGGLFSMDGIAKMMLNMMGNQK